MKKQKIMSSLLVALVLIIISCFSAFAYRESDKPIRQVRFTVSGKIDQGMTSALINVGVPNDVKYQYAGYELQGLSADGLSTTVKLIFKSANGYYFRVTKHLQISVPVGLEYVSAAREDQGYSLAVVINIPVGPDFAYEKYVEGWDGQGETRVYRNADGSLATGWKKIEGKSYYFGKDAILVRNQWIDGTFYVDENGEMLCNTITPDGYMVGADGRWINEEAANTEAAVQEQKPQENTHVNSKFDVIVNQFKETFKDDKDITDIHVENGDTICITIDIPMSTLSEMYPELVGPMVQQMDEHMSSSLSPMPEVFSREAGQPVHIKVTYTVNGREYLTRLY